jgi:hypothetical protein
MFIDCKLAGTDFRRVKLKGCTILGASLAVTRLAVVTFCRSYDGKLSRTVARVGSGGGRR